MDATSEPHGITEIKNTLRNYLIESNNAAQPELAVPRDGTLALFRRLNHLPDQPHLAQLVANEDVLTQQLEYEEVVMLHSGYAPQSVRHNAGVVTATLDAMTTIPLLSLPAEIRAMIWEYALPYNQLVFTNDDSRAWNDKGEFRHHDKPALLRVCQQISSEATPIYFYNQTFSYYSSDDYDAVNFLALFLMDLGQGVKAIRKLGVDVEDDDMRLQVKLKDGECSVTAWVWEWDDDDEVDFGGVSMMKYIQTEVRHIEKVVKGTGINWPAAGPTIEVKDHPGPLPFLWSDEFEIEED